VTLYNRGDNETYRKKEDLEGNSYALIQAKGQVVGSDTGQYTKTN